MKQFSDISDFIAHLVERVALVEIAQHHGLEVGARVIEAEAKHEIGTYQSGAGPFDRWAPLAESTLEGWGGHPGKIELGYAPPDNPLLRTGALRDAIDHSVEGHEAAIGVPSRIVTVNDKSVDVGDVAIWQELGTAKIPPRSFLGRAGFVKEKEVAEVIGIEIVHAISGVRPNR